MLNRQRAQLTGGMCPDKELLADWVHQRAADFAFETLDVLEPRDDPPYDPTEDLRVLKALWLEKLGADGEDLYKRSFPGM